MKLIVAEKPSVARAIAAVVGAAQKHTGYLQGEDYIVSWAVGHLVEPEDAAAYGDYAKWRIEDLPIVPTTWQYRVNANTADQYNVLQELMHRSDVTSLVCATDAGREGELIFRLIYQQVKCTKPFERLWANSLEEQDLCAAIDNLRPSRDYDNLFAAAQLRQQADWLVGINYSRFISCQYKHSLSVGRVQTPVLQMIARRHYKIADFTPEPYYILTAQLGDMTASTRIASAKAAQEVAQRCRGQEATVTLITPEQHKVQPPPLHSLSTLQGEANTQLGLTAQQTLTIAQALYEKKLITYPRTNSNYIPDSIQATLSERLRNLQNLPKYTVEIDMLLKRPLPVIANGSKVTDHHAIIPTMLANPDAVPTSPDERAVFDLICSRTIIAMGEEHCCATINVTWDIAGEPFKAIAKTVTSEGWRGVQHRLGRDDAEHEERDIMEQTLTRQLSEQETQLCTDVRTEEKKTQPPKAYSDRTLLEAMKGVGRQIDDIELRQAIADGLGTEATRAGIIERLITMGYVQRDKKSLVPTIKGLLLLEAIPWNEVKDAEMTAEWELMLAGVEKGELQPFDFLRGITEQVSSYIVASKESDNVNPIPNIEFNQHTVVGSCPCCGGKMLEGKKSFYCETKDFSLWKDDAFFATKGKELTSELVQQLLTGKEIELKGCISKSGNKYTAKVTFAGVNGGRAQYSMSFVDTPKPDTKPTPSKKPHVKSKTTEK